MKLYRELSNLLILNECSLQEDLEEYLVIKSVIRTIITCCRNILGRVDAI